MPYGDIFSFANNQKAQQAAEPDDNYGMPSNWAPINSAPIDPNKPAATRTPASIDPYGSGPLPPNFGYQPALVRSGYGGTAAPIDLMPIQGAGVTQANAKAIGVATKVAQDIVSESSVLFQTNNISNSTQDVLNITGSGVSYGPGTGQVSITSAELPTLIDNFTNFSAALTGNFVSQLPWEMVELSAFQQSINPSKINSVGGLGFSGTATASQVNFLVHGLGSAASWVNGITDSWSLFDNPGWTLSWTFTVGRPYLFTQSRLPAAFSWSKVSFYIGLGNYPSITTPTTTTVPRPPYFVGLRYDTDTTSPSIGDTQFVFEAVANSTWTTTRAALNPQGNTSATGIAATEGTTYTFTMSSTTAGSVTMTLSNGTANYTATLAVPQFSASTNGAYIANGIGELAWTSLGGVPAGPGTQMIISGATGSYASFNGTQTILGGGGAGTFADIALAGSAGFGAAVMTTKCYPSVLPYMTFGNDSEVGPTADSKAVVVNQFTFRYTN